MELFFADHALPQDYDITVLAVGIRVNGPTCVMQHFTDIFGGKSFFAAKYE